MVGDDDFNSTHATHVNPGIFKFAFLASCVLNGVVCYAITLVEPAAAADEGGVSATFGYVMAVIGLGLIVAGHLARGRLLNEVGVVAYMKTALTEAITESDGSVDLDREAVATEAATRRYFVAYIIPVALMALCGILGLQLTTLGGDLSVSYAMVGAAALAILMTPTNPFPAWAQRAVREL